MSLLSISGNSAEQFFESTKNALEEFTGSPISKEAKIRQFLKNQLSLPNEHQYDSVFNDAPVTKTVSGESVYILTLSCIDEDGNSSAQDTVVCSSAEKLDAASARLFGKIFYYCVESNPDKAGGYILNYSDVMSAIETLVFNPLHTADQFAVERFELTQQVADMDCAKATDWLIANIDNDYLFGDFLTEISGGRYSLDYVFTVIE